MRLLNIIFFLYLGITISSVSAQVLAPEDMELDQLTSQADLVFQGTVKKIEYRASVDKIPHTFVTYEIEDVIQGRYNRPTITLRFVGGFMERNGEVIQLTVSHAPDIKQGEQSVLMVKGNDSVQCPLVACSFGRFNFVNGNVADGGGRMMAMDADGKVRRIRNPDNPMHAQMNNDLGPHVSLPQHKNIHSALMDNHSFVAHLRGLVNKSGPAKSAKLNSKQVRSADPNKPFHGPKITVGPPPSSNNANISANKHGGEAVIDHNRWEEEELRKSGGNPVFKKRYPGHVSSSH